MKKSKEKPVKKTCDWLILGINTQLKNQCLAVAKLRNLKVSAVVEEALNGYVQKKEIQTLIKKQLGVVED
jgi:post-segregation antitoxin (ccd killing protein)